ncbi:MAG: 5-(carboxyamino)imidazole ribonucleotide synthase [Flavobacteriales bacterium]|nr:5-(carboxyamino)imidazole ribonucleotide synthase [Flavobacteriales bacterium]
MRNIHHESFKIGMLGGGQLGRMSLQEAYNLNLHISILDPSPNAPCKPLTDDFVQGDFKDFETVYNFGKDKDVMTIEFEDVNSDALQKLEEEGVKVFPQPKILKLIQDKGLQKQFYQKHGLPTSPFELIENKNEIANSKLNFPLFQKLRTSGYDGYGVQKIDSKDALDQAMDGPSVLEEGVDLQTELSVVIARNEAGEIKHFPLVELAFNPKANMVEFLFSPASVSEEIEKKAYSLATELMDKLGMVGLLAVEMFLSKDGELMINEIAPRAHNSGHHSIEGNFTSQFGQHLRAILNLPLGNTDIRNAAVMVNLLGEEGHTGEAIYQGMEDALKLGGVYPHLYGKSQVKPFRKMGHITIIDDDVEKAKAKARKVKEMVKVVSKESL